MAVDDWSGDCVRCSKEREIAEIHRAVIGTASEPGLAESVRALRVEVERQGDVRKAVFGNGAAGLVEDVRILKGWFGGMKWFLRAVVLAGLGVVAWFFQR